MEWLPGLSENVVTYLTDDTYVSYRPPGSTESTATRLDLTKEETALVIGRTFCFILDGDWRPQVEAAHFPKSIYRLFLEHYDQWSNWSYGARDVLEELAA